MEGNSNFVKLYGIFKHLREDVGDLSKIRYKSGNEEAFSRIIRLVKDYLIMKQLLTDNRTNSEHAEELRNITSLFIMNTKFERANLEDIKEYAHFLRAIPTLSTCVAVNIIMELDLAKYCASLLLILPFNCMEELLPEMLTCLRHSEPKQVLRHTCAVLDAVIKALIALDGRQDDDEIADRITDVATEMLQNLGGFNVDEMKKWKSAQISAHMGYTLLSLLRLLQGCPLYICSLTRLIVDMVSVTTNVVQAVNVNIFCVWAEVKYSNGQPLQIVVANEAYTAIEHLQKYEPAAGLIQMLSAIARKPKTIQEIIMEADTAAMIENIDRGGDNQRLWFRAFLETKVFEHEASMKCIERWIDLCTPEDVLRLLSASLRYKDHKVKKLVLRCAGKLSAEELAYVTGLYVRENSSNHLETESLKGDLVLLLNKLHKDWEEKEIYLLLLQNVEAVLDGLYDVYLKGCPDYMKGILERIKPIVEIRGLASTLLIKKILDQPPTLKSIANYSSFIEVLLKLQYTQEDVLIREVFVPSLEKCLQSDDPELMYSLLRLLNLIPVNYTIRDEMLPLIKLLSNILEKYRCQFFTFSLFKLNIIQAVIEFILKCNFDNKYKDFFKSLEMNIPINKFYFDGRTELLSYIYPTYVTDTNTEILANLIKILPTCATIEWISIVKQLEMLHGYQTTLALLEDLIILLCQITKSQKSNDTATAALKYCLQEYGSVIKCVLQCKHSSLEDQVLLTKSICNLLKDIPDDVRKCEGMQLVSLLSDDSLKSLKQDKAFVVSLVAINDSTVSQVIAQKMLA